MYDEEDGNGGNNFTEVEHEGYFDKLGNSFGGVCIGLVVFILAFPLLWWNEGRAVDTYQAINEGRKVVVSINTTAIDPLNEDRLVHFSGLAEAMPTYDLTDPDFGISGLTGKIRLNRDVEMYQWVEKKTTRKVDKLGGGTDTVTDYSYSKQWSSSRVDSTRFRYPANHANPTDMPYLSEVFYADVIVGAFELPDILKQKIDGESSRLGTTLNTTNIPPNNILLAQQKNVTIYGAGYYFGTVDVASIGDTRVSYEAGEGGVVSILAKQKGTSLVPYKAESGAEILDLDMGEVSWDAMFNSQAAENKTLTWILRFVGALCMIIGISMLLNPLAVAGDIIPCIGDCIGAAVGIVATVIGLFLSLLVIGIAWVANRPVILGVAAGGTALVGYLVYAGFRKKRAKSRGGSDFGTAGRDLELKMERHTVQTY